MAYYAALVSLVELLKEMSLSEHQYPKYLFQKQQITPLYEKFSHLQVLLDDYSPTSKEADGFLERIREVASRVEHFIERQTSDAACRERHTPDATSREWCMPDAAYEEKCMIEAQISDQVREPNCLSKIRLFCHFTKFVFCYFIISVLAYYNSESEPMSISMPESEIESMPELEFLSESESESESEIESMPESESMWTMSISMPESEIEFLSESEPELEPENEGVVETTRKGYQDFLKLGEVPQGYQDLLKLREVIRHVVEVGYEDLEKTKKEVDSFMGEGYLDVVKLKEELAPIEIKGYQNLVKLKEELDATIRRGHQDLERVKEEVDYVVGKGYDDLLEEVLKEEVDPIVEEMRMRIKDSHTTHQEDLQVTIDEPSDDGTTMVILDENLIATIKAQLLGNSSKLEVISIVGMGGIGKTTLARHIFDDKGIHNHFDIRVWVTISQSYQLRKILLAIAKSLNIKNGKLDEVEDEVLKDHIRKHLFGWRYLVIMDDVWDAQIWDVVRWIFPNDNKSTSRVMITTRQSDVAFLATESDFINEIPILAHDQSWILFCEKVYCPLELEDIGRLIVQKCGGLPLAIVVVAGLLSKVNTLRSDWEEVARGLSSTAAANDEHFSKILSLSYNYLPHHLKPCFLYLGGFPEDSEIRISMLVLLWVAEGFLKPVASKCLEEVAEEYLEELVKRNLVLVKEERPNGKVKSCIMHDLLRDMCLERARHEHFLLIPHIHNATKHTHRFFIRPESPFDIDMLSDNVRHVRSIVSFSQTEVDLNLHPSSFKPLRVLHAPLTRYSFLHDEVFQLLNLRMLVLDYSIREPEIPSSISQLQHLQTLIGGFDSGKFSLPAEIWEMPRLRHVMVEYLTLPPCSDGGSNKSDGLPSLQTLYTLRHFTFTSRIVEMIQSIKKLKLFCSLSGKNAWTKFGLIYLDHLHQLETLAIEISYYDATVMPFPESFAFPSNLRKLTLEGCRLPWGDMTVVGKLPHLQVLKLRERSFVGKRWKSKEGEFPKLKFLGMYILSEIKYWRTKSTHFPCLEHLVINFCHDLEEIPSEIGEFPNLKFIEVWSMNSRLKASALEIQEELLSIGNETLEVRVNGLNGEARWDESSSDD